MKRILTSGLLALCAGVLSMATTMHEPHQLTSLWKKYEEARKADLPQKEAEILSQIKQEAQTKHLAVDFYDAATEYVNTVQRRDWKQRDALRTQLQQEVEAFGDPMVTFLWMDQWKGSGYNELWPYVQAHPEGFQGRNAAFYDGLSSYLGGTLKPFIQNDKEYVLWRLLKDIYNLSDDNPLYQTLQQEVQGRYPAQAALELYVLDKRSWRDEQREQQRAAYQALADRYAGKAVSLYPRAQLLRMRMTDLEKAKAPESAFQTLHADAKAFEKERSSYKADEAVIASGCTRVESLVEDLEEQDLEVEMDEQGIRVVFQNLTKAKVTLRRDDQTVQTWNVENPAQRFYLQDTVLVARPQLPDATYSVEAVSGVISDQASYLQYTLSIATRLDGNGTNVYVADYRTGEPLKKVTLRLLRADREMATSELQLKGFTPLPSAMQKLLDIDSDVHYSLVAISGDRRSRPVALQRFYYGGGDLDYPNAFIFKDQGAYRPGETLRFKAVVFDGNPVSGFQVRAGKPVDAILYDTEGNELEHRRLTTNEYGSAWGEFILPKGLRNGHYRLSLNGLASDSFRVDEFVLPSFDLSWDALDKLYFSGDVLPIGGELLSYSGHNLSGSQLHLEVRCYGSLVQEADTVADGRRFRFEVPTRREGWYQTTLTVTDLTGETREFRNGFYLGDRLHVEAQVENAADAELVLTDDKQDRYWYNRTPRSVIRSKELCVKLLGKDGGGRPVPVPVQYRLLDAAGKVVTEGEAPSGSTVTLQLPASGLYTLATSVSAVRKASGKTVFEESKQLVLCTLPADKTLPERVKSLFLSGDETLADGKGIDAVLGSGNAPVWAVVTLYGPNRQVLESKQVKLGAHSVAAVGFDYKAAYPDAVCVHVYYFLNGENKEYTRQYRRAKDRYSLPLQFTRLTTDALPGTEYSVTLKTAPGVEALAAVWDKSLDAISANEWPLAHFRDVTVEYVFVNEACGRVGPGNDNPILYQAGMARGGVMEEAMVEDAVMAKSSAEASSPDEEDVNVRSDFATALCFQPALQPAADGTLSFSFRTSDKLSTYYIRVYAHDAAMHNAQVQEEMVVSLPVQVQLVAPRFLYAGDVWEAAVSVSSVADEPVSGRMILRAGDTEQQVPVTVPAGKGASHRFVVRVPDPSSPAPTGDLLVTAIFRADAFSDAVQATVPVLPAAQQLTEAHSAVLHDGQDREALLADLRARFVNVPASAATLREISVLDMVLDAIPSHVEPAGKDVLSLSEAWYVRLMAAKLSAKGMATSSAEDPDTDELLDKILACQNADGGFAWFEGMDSSPVLTAVVLERMAKLRDRGFEVPELTSAVEFLDKEQFTTVRPIWRGGVTDEQYLYVRSLYAEVPFGVKPVSVEDGKRMDAFKAWAKDYLAPSTKAGRGLTGQILPKARRVLTLKNLRSREGGVSLAKAWGVKFSARCRLERSLKKDMASLKEYAVEHRDGGWYYPNAVLPWRGLLESEAYAHALLCDLLAEEGSDIADGIRLWLMLQKETQHWDTDPAFIDAITAILDGSEAVLNTRVLVLSANYEAPFADVKATGNGFTVERRFYRDGVEIQPGETVAVGDKIEAKYAIWNAENRSFVKLTAGREASLSPVQQFSGRIWGGGYRNVKAGCTEFFFDSYPEEKSQLSETFFVTQAGTFQAPVVVIESLYAPHYRANDACRTPLTSAAAQ